MKKISLLCSATALAGSLFAAKQEAAATWEAQMADNAGSALATASAFDLPRAVIPANKVYPVRDRLEVKSLNGSWQFKSVSGIVDKAFADVEGEAELIRVPGCWENEGFKTGEYGNQLSGMTGFYRTAFRYDPRWEGRRVFLRFDGVLYGYKVVLNGQAVGSWGSAFNMAQFDVTEALRKEGKNVLDVTVWTRSHGWLFDVNDDWSPCGIFRPVELFSVPKEAHLKDVTFVTKRGGKVNGEGGGEAEVEVEVKVEAEGACGVYVSLADKDGIHKCDFVGKNSGETLVFTGTVPTAKLWSAEDPYLHDLAVTLVDANGKKLQRVVEKVGLVTREVRKDGFYVNGKKVFFKGMGWNEIDPVEGRAISFETRYRNLKLMKEAGVNAIRTAHYPFGTDFYALADEMGFYVIDEVPFGSRGREFLKNKAYKDELLARTEATIGRDKNHASVVAWTFGNENDIYPNTIEVLKYAREKDPTRPKALPEIGSHLDDNVKDSEARGWYNQHYDEYVDFFSGHYLSGDRMKSLVEHSPKPLMQTEFAHACGNGFPVFEDRFSRMWRDQDHWMGGFIWLWSDQATLDDPLTLELKDPGPRFPKDGRRAMPRHLQGMMLDARRLVDSWGDRGTDGIVYGDGTPKEAYYLVKKIYTDPDRYFGMKEGESKGAEARIEAPVLDLQQPGTAGDGSAFSLKLEDLRLRHGRPCGMNYHILSRLNGNPKKRKSWDPGDEYLAKAEVLENGKVRFDLGNGAAWEGLVVVKQNKDKTCKIAYNLKPNEAAAKRGYLELGLAVEMPTDFDRVDWIGKGPYTSTIGKSLMNAYGQWSVHRDDFRFFGNRNVDGSLWCGKNGSAEAVLLTSETGNMTMENVGGRIVVSENVQVAGFYGKADQPSSVKGGDRIKLKGELFITVGRLPAVPSAIAPDMTFTATYGY